MAQQSYTLTSPEGQTVTFTAPVGMSDDDLVQRAQQELRFKTGEIPVTFGGGAQKALMEPVPESSPVLRSIQQTGLKAGKGVLEGAALGLAAPVVLPYAAIRHPKDTAKAVGGAALLAGRAAGQAAMHPLDTINETVLNPNYDPEAPGAALGGLLTGAGFTRAAQSPLGQRVTAGAGNAIKAAIPAKLLNAAEAFRETVRGVPRQGGFTPGYRTAQFAETTAEGGMPAFEPNPVSMSAGSSSASGEQAIADRIKDTLAQRAPAVPGSFSPAFEPNPISIGPTGEAIVANQPTAAAMPGMRFAGKAPTLEESLDSLLQQARTTPTNEVRSVTLPTTGDITSMGAETSPRGVFKSSGRPATRGLEGETPTNSFGTQRYRNARTGQLEEDLRVARREADTDPLTDVANRRALDRALPSAEADANTSVIAFDANNFGQVNKQFGQEAGDATLKSMASAVRQAAEEAGMGGRVFRRGGDEFVVLAPKARAQAIQTRAEELFGVQQAGETPVSLTGNIGSTFKEADTGLQAAKKAAKAAQAPAKSRAMVKKTVLFDEFGKPLVTEQVPKGPVNYGGMPQQRTPVDPRIAALLRARFGQPGTP